jgi:hypothetical protein
MEYTHNAGSEVCGHCYIVIIESFSFSDLYITKAYRLTQELITPT